MKFLESILNAQPPVQTPTQYDKKKILGAVVGLIVVAIIIGAVIIGSNPGSFGLGTQQVQVKVQYSGTWQGAYTDVESLVSWSGTGSKTVTLTRPSGYSLWIISANAQKMDDSADSLTVSIVKMDGTVLKQASTVASYGVAQVAFNIEG